MTVSAAWDDKLPLVFIPTSTKISFIFFAVLFFTKPSSNIDHEINALSFVLWKIFQLCVYLYILDFVSGMMHGLFDNFPFLGPLKRVPHDTRNIREYSKQNGISIRFYERLAYIHQRHHTNLWVKHLHKMNCVLHGLFFIPISIYLMCSNEYILWFNDWLYWLIYGL
eukprot:279099_1